MKDKIIVKIREGSIAKGQDQDSKKWKVALIINATNLVIKSAIARRILDFKDQEAVLKVP